MAFLENLNFGSIVVSKRHVGISLRYVCIRNYDHESWLAGHTALDYTALCNMHVRAVLVYTLDYLINAHCAFIYFQEKSCPVRPYSIVVNSTKTALCVYLFLEKIPCPVRILDS